MVSLTDVLVINFLNIDKCPARMFRCVYVPFSRGL